tara:strand:+ start:62 stop:523 length:462 start_codon:yes stop_codon:yes gene_type:complete
MPKKETNKWLERLNSLSSKRIQDWEETQKEGHPWAGRVNEIKQIMQPLIKEIKIIEESYKKDFDFKYYEHAVDIKPKKTEEGIMRITALLHNKEDEPWVLGSRFSIFIEDYRDFSERRSVNPRWIGWLDARVETMDGVMDWVVKYIADHMDYE